MKSDTIEVLPLLKEGVKAGYPGWCSYGDTLKDQPEIEIFCGGINSKQAGAAGLWRQGNLLHWGFEPDPAEMNEVGRALFVNAIVYISRFSEDRVTIRTRSPFSGKRTAMRSSAARWLADDKLLELAMGAIEPEKGVPADKPEAVRAWFADNEQFLHDNGKGKLVVDADARALKLDWTKSDFFERALAHLDGKPDEASRAAAVLARHVADGPGGGASAANWREWLAANRPYLFYCERANYRWCLDALAKQRGVPTAELRGPARADVRPKR